MPFQGSKRDICDTIGLSRSMPFFDNKALTSISGLSNLNAEFNSAMISSNDQLSICNLPFICQLAEEDNILLELNAEGCSSNLEVKTSCEPLSIKKDLINEMISLAPNPSNGRIKILNYKNNFAPFCIYNQNAQVIFVGIANDNLINLKDLEAGLYYLKIEGQVLKLTLVD